MNISMCAFLTCTLSTKISMRPHTNLILTMAHNIDCTLPSATVQYVLECACLLVLPFKLNLCTISYSEGDDNGRCNLICSTLSISWHSQTPAQQIVQILELTATRLSPTPSRTKPVAARHALLWTDALHYIHHCILRHRQSIHHNRHNNIPVSNKMDI